LTQSISANIHLSSSLHAVPKIQVHKYTIYSRAYCDIALFLQIVFHKQSHMMDDLEKKSEVTFINNYVQL